jgi:hypothetical protein
MKTKIKQILLDNLTSNYDGGNIDDGGIGGGEKTVDLLYDLFVDEMTAIGTATVSSRPPKEEEPKYFNPKTGKTQKLFDTLNPVYTVRYVNPYVGDKGEAVYITLEANEEEEAKDKAMLNKEFTKHIFMKYYDRKYLTAYKPSGNYVINKVQYFSGDPRL